jgi:hypothetical protein
VGVFFGRDLERQAPGREIIEEFGLEITSGGGFKGMGVIGGQEPRQKSVSTGIRRVTILSKHAEHNQCDAWAKFDGRLADQINNGIE